MDTCTVGLKLNDECHQLHFTRKTGVMKICPGDLKLLQLRLNHKFSGTSTICHHHEKVWLDKYEFLQKVCCDPMKKHKKHVKSDLRSLTVDMAEKINQFYNLHLIPGQQLCRNCRKLSEVKRTEVEKMEMQEPDLDEPSLETDLFDENAGKIEPIALKESLNVSFSEIGVSPLKTKVGTRDYISYGKRKLHETTSAVQKTLAHALGIEEHNLQSTPIIEKKCDNLCSDYHKLIELMKVKCLVSSRREQCRILTAVPQSWSIEKTAAEFGVSQRLVKKARKVRDESGVFAKIPKKRGKTLQNHVVLSVTAFYEDDDISRICPGKKDFVSVRIDGKRTHMQKRLLLFNIKEIHGQFKIKHPDLKVGFSKFCEIRPAWCVPVGAKGTHSVCVCQIHQNVKLMVAALPTKLDYHDLVKKLVCSTESSLCMIHRCEKCPLKQELSTYLEKTMDDQDYDSDDIIKYKCWQHTDRTTLVSQECTVEEFIAELVEAMDKFTTHQFTAKSQSAFLKKCKETLSETTAIVLLDFAENYSFVVQDAVQGFHWENSQATLHPFCIYYKQDEALQCLNLCIISDCLTHDVFTVHTFLGNLVDFIKSKLPDVNHLIYFSDGAASQYKNCKNFLNLCHHEEDFGISAEWHFFATSHGKSPCDGIGGTVKRLAARTSLQRPLDNQILTPVQLFDWAVSDVTGVSFLYVDSETVHLHTQDIEERLESAKTLQGTRGFHSYVPKSKESLAVKRISSEEDEKLAYVVNTKLTLKQNIPSIGEYVACMYDSNWWIGLVVEVNPDYDDMHVQFMHPSGPARSFCWPRREDLCYIPVTHVLCSLPVPSTSSGRQYKLEREILQNVELLAQRFNEH